jgi:hypothetical protein
MAVTAFATGTQTATIGTEHTLSDVNQAGVFQLVVDTDNLAAGDVVELRVYAIVLTGGTRKGAYYQLYSDEQAPGELIKYSVPVSNELTDTGSVRFTLKQTRGTGRNFDWKVLKHA